MSAPVELTLGARALIADQEERSKKDSLDAQILKEKADEAERVLRQVLGMHDAVELPPHSWAWLYGGPGLTGWVRTVIDGLTFVWKSGCTISWERPSDKELLAFGNLLELGRLLRLAMYVPTDWVGGATS